MLTPSRDPKKIAVIVIAVLLALWFLRTANDAPQRNAERAADAQWVEATRAQERLAEENARRSRDAMKSIPKLNFQ